MKPKSISEALRDAVRTCPQNQNQLGQLSGVSPSVLSRFINERRALTLRVIDPLCEALGLELWPIQPAKERRNRKSKKKG